MATSIEAVPGLFYYKDVATSQQQDLIDFIASPERVWETVGETPYTRRVCHFGYTYHYDTGLVSPSTFAIVEPLCSLGHLAQQCLEQLFPSRAIPPLTQCLINEYVGELGQGIIWHTDKPVFGPYVACFSFGSAADMQFRQDAEADVHTLHVEPGSLYLMTGPARETFEHAMPWRTEATAKKFSGTRYSVTFRSVL
jgi:alkylated DNA repair dioxygenase AlkB